MGTASPVVVYAGCQGRSSLGVSYRAFCPVADARSARRPGRGRRVGVAPKRPKASSRLAGRRTTTGSPRRRSGGWSGRAAGGHRPHRGLGSGQGRLVGCGPAPRDPDSSRSPTSRPLGRRWRRYLLPRTDSPNSISPLSSNPPPPQAHPWSHRRRAPSGKSYRTFNTAGPRSQEQRVPTWFRPQTGATRQSQGRSATALSEAYQPQAISRLPTVRPELRLDHRIFRPPTFRTSRDVRWSDC